MFRIFWKGITETKWGDTLHSRATVLLVAATLYGGNPKLYSLVNSGGEEKTVLPQRRFVC